MKKQLINTFRRIALCSTILWTTWACQEIPETPIQDSPLEIEKDFDLNSDPDLKKFLEKNNFAYTTIEKFGESYLIDRDIILSRESILSSPIPKTHKGGVSTENLHAYESLISSSPYNYKTITIGFDSTIPTTSHYLNWRTATAEAIAEYNQIRNLRLKFEIITTGTPDITITSQPKTGIPWSAVPDAIASAHFPSGGNPGIKIHINPSYFDRNNVTESIKKYNIAHELGHTIGFRHTNYLTNDHSSTHSTAQNVKGTGNSDLNSVMNGGTAGNSWTSFSYLDLLAMRTLYPYDAGELPLYSYIKPATGGFNWTIDWSTYQYGGSGYSYYGLNGYVYAYALSGTVPLYKYKHNTTHVDYMSLNPNLGASFPGYVNQGLIGYVFTSSAPNRIPIYEWYHPSKGFHFTTLTNDGVVQSGGWTGGGIAFYAITLEWW
jgi:hypothetical protein